MRARTDGCPFLEGDRTLGDSRYIHMDSKVMVKQHIFCIFHLIERYKESRVFPQHFTSRSVCLSMTVVAFLCNDAIESTQHEIQIQCYIAVT